METMLLTIGGLGLEDFSLYREVKKQILDSSLHALQNISHTNKKFNVFTALFMIL